VLDYQSTLSNCIFQLIVSDRDKLTQPQFLNLLTFHFTLLLFIKWGEQCHPIAQQNYVFQGGVDPPLAATPDGAACADAPPLTAS